MYTQGAGQCAAPRAIVRGAGRDKGAPRPAAAARGGGAVYPAGGGTKGRRLIAAGGRGGAGARGQAGGAGEGCPPARGVAATPSQRRCRPGASLPLGPGLGKARPECPTGIPGAGGEGGSVRGGLCSEMIRFCYNAGGFRMGSPFH